MNLHGNARLTPFQRALMCSRVREEGWTVETVAELLGRHRATVDRVLASAGGLPCPRTGRRADALTIGEREEISLALASGTSLRGIAKTLGRSPSTICREVNNNGGRDHLPGVGR